MANGRPLFVGDEARSATIGRGGEWTAIEALDVDAIDPALRQRLAELWSRDALFEHASVASFSRFSLHLLAVAAPPELVDAAHRAAIDEVRHARLCFALASAYAGEPLGPGPLPLEGDILGPLDLASIAVATVKEGCIGETVASLEAATALDTVQEEAPREALEIIAEDEARHAELAWKFVRFCLDVGDAEVRRAVAKAFDEAIAAPTPPLVGTDPMDEALAAHGRLSEARRRAVYAEAIEDVIKPAAAALLGR